MITSTNDLKPIDDFFISSGLEMGNEPVDRRVQQIWQAKEAGRLIGAATLGLRDGHWVVDGIAVLPDYRHRGLGRRLLEQVVAEARRCGAKTLWLVAMSPGFFEKECFSYIDYQQAPAVFGCTDCHIRGVSCHPRWMYKHLSD